MQCQPTAFWAPLFLISMLSILLQFPVWGYIVFLLLLSKSLTFQKSVEVLEDVVFVKKLGMVVAIISLNIFPAHFSFPSGILIKYMLLHLKMSQIYLRLCSFFLILFPVFFRLHHLY